MTQDPKDTPGTVKSGIERPVSVSSLPTGNPMGPPDFNVWQLPNQPDC